MLNMLIDMFPTAPPRNTFLFNLLCVFSFFLILADEIKIVVVLSVDSPGNLDLSVSVLSGRRVRMSQNPLRRHSMLSAASTRLSVLIAHSTAEYYTALPLVLTSRDHQQGSSGSVSSPPLAVFRAWCGLVMLLGEQSVF